MTPEMFRTPLHEVSLSIKLLRLGSIGEFLSKAIQAPPIDSVIEAEVTLRGKVGIEGYYSNFIILSMHLQFGLLGFFMNHPQESGHGKIVSAAFFFICLSFLHWLHNTIPRYRKHLYFHHPLACHNSSCRVLLSQSLHFLLSLTLSPYSY